MSGKVKMGPETHADAANSAKRLQVEYVVDMG